MAAGFLSPPGTEFGPCAHECTHLDCAAVRATVAEICCHCGDPIGYQARFFEVDEGLVHLVCEIKAAEEEGL